MASECKKFINVFLAVFITLIGVILIARTLPRYSVVAAGYALISDARTKLVDLAFVNYYATAVFVAAILLVILLTFGGICGVAGTLPFHIGSLKNNAYCLLFYAIISIVCALWFLAVAIAALKAPDAYFGSDNCASTDYFTQLNNYTLAAAQNGVCQTGCQCYLTTTSQSAYNATFLATLTISASDTSKAVKNQDCTNAWNTGSTPTGADTVMAYLETFLSCTSWCNSTTYPLTLYRFTNVNNGTTLLIQEYPRSSATRSSGPM